MAGYTDDDVRHVVDLIETYGQPEDLARQILDRYTTPDIPATAGDPKPRFVLAAHDIHTPTVIGRYIELCAAHGQQDQARQAQLALAEICDWQNRHPRLVRYTNHHHIPATAGDPEETRR